MPTLVKHTPSRRELFFPKNDERLQIRSKVLAASGAATVALGMSAIVISSRSMNRVRSETAKIRKMFAQNTTVSQLQNMISNGQKLPETILIKGVIKSSSDSKVFSIANKIDQLKPMIGQSTPFFSEHKWLNKFLLSQKLVHPRAALAENLLVSEIFVTRLGCEAERVGVWRIRPTGVEPVTTRGVKNCLFCLSCLGWKLPKMR
jgi:hypothetical protein